MAKLYLENGEELKDTASINRALAPLNVKLASWPVGSGERLLSLLAKPALDNDEKEEGLKGFDVYFNQLKAELGYQTRDMIVINSDLPNLDTLLAKFNKCHTHDDDEVRYIVDGEGIFGFVLPNGTQAEILVEAGDYINVPANTEHWFYLTPKKRIKAVRYFTSMDGWSPVYTDTKIRIGELSKKAA